jgi:regulator of cell morphogenesis and NO signaling
MNFDASQQEIAPITEALGRDHDRLASLEASAFAARDRGDFAAGTQLFERFARELERHIAFEEELLFPVVEREMGLTSGGGPTAVMREEHAQIKSLLGEIAPGMKDPDAPVEGRRQALGAVLQEHNMKEEQILYPMADQALGRERAGLLAREIETFRR